MRAHLAPHAHAVAIDGDLVLLDVRRDAYACLADTGRLTLAPDRRSLEAQDVDALAPLASAGLLAARPTRVRAPPPRPLRGLAPPETRAAGREALRLGLACADLAGRYAGRPFARVLAAVRPLPAAIDVPDPEVLRLAAVFRSAVVWAPVDGKCLVRAFLLRRFLERSGRSAAWVFGVRVWPFGAHCWLQSGEVALDDAPERLAPYHPILAV
jgi:hypothetical protein